jgi:hypothetical protein
MIAFMSGCALLASAGVVWLVAHFTTAQAGPGGAGLEDSASLATTRPAGRDAPGGRETLPDPTAPKTRQLVPFGHLPALPAAGFPDAATAAAYTQDLISALRDQYGTNPYFRSRNQLKQHLSLLFDAARVVRERVQAGGPPDAVGRARQEFEVALAGTIERLDYILGSASKKDQDEAELTRSLRPKFAGIRISPPGSRSG